MKIKDVKKRFKNKNVLDGINCDIGEGSIVGMIGPNGSGKTTLIKILATLLRPSSGRFWIDGLSPKKDIWRFRRKVAYCPDRLPLDGRMTGYEFLKFFSDIYGRGEEVVENILKIVDLSKDADRPIADYSKGMQKRVSISRVLLIEPKVYLLDEPTSGLDPTGQRIIQNLILSIEKKGKVVFLSSHNHYEVERICDTILFLKDGRFETVDTVSEAFGRDNMVIIDITLKDLNDDIINGVLKRCEDLIFLSSGKNRVRFTSRMELDKETLLTCIKKEGGEVLEVKFL